MSAASIAAASTNRPDPSRDRPVAAVDAPSRTVRLLGLVRKLIDYGKELATTLQQRTSATNLATVTLCFGTIDIALILSLITRGMHRAAALEDRLVGRAIRQEAVGPAAATAPSPRQPRAAQPAARSADGAESRVARLPTPGDIAAQVRHRPIGAVIADICRDLGIVPSDPLWRELSDAIVENGGNIAALYSDINKRLWRSKADPPPIRASVAVPTEPESCPPSAVAFGTGPP